ncbi:hypothetical protein WKR88_20590 [Trinickia caryophylli]|uniref:Uncharacterized protein n=1 Tax=Trinickia caryophylli TaxID=28094 RepID=A0A1X7F2F9_TRICW|nr:hypothetical protein [Trinickia caryophylli]TRX19495.1 hypothetical protein FNF07_15570 [Trinickia caryophylli]WQE13196.1 hypothetical protein U0034_07385 [Trinickia caryophylli]GLU34495.1 hypothetical protein Busp01_43370 [Trinickia caryophylli]SMF44687.1 hypothetical protein SAMN06295900_10771 [Trinickia caryophylli]
MSNQANVSGSHNFIDQGTNFGTKVLGDHNQVEVSTHDTYIVQPRTEIRQYFSNPASRGETQNQSAFWSGIVMTAFTSWLYVKHFDATASCLRYGAVASALPALLALVLFVLRSRSDSCTAREAGTVALGPAVAVALLTLLDYVAGAFPRELFALVNDRNMLRFWLTLSEPQRQALMQNIVALFFVALGVGINFMMSLHTMSDEVLAKRAPTAAVRIFALTYRFRPASALIKQLLFIAIALLSVTGKGVAWYRQAIELVVALL